MAGRYDGLAMSRGLEADWRRFRDRYFQEDGRGTEISSEIKNRVKFKRFNLQDSFTQMGRFDVVLLRNVAIYFSEEFKRNIFERVADAMSPGGYLLLGSAETLIGLSDRFQNEAYGQARFYRLKD
jgi:chemotaxis protein methyltransferase CheR